MRSETEPAKVRVLDLPSPEAYQFDLERMVGRHIALIAEIRRQKVFHSFGRFVQVIQRQIKVLREVAFPQSVSPDKLAGTLQPGRRQCEPGGPLAAYLVHVAVAHE